MKKTFDILSQMVEEGVIEGYAIGGAVAAIYYTEPVNTSDLDVLVSLPVEGVLVSVEPLYHWLREKGYGEFIKEGVMVEGLPVQFLPVAGPLSKECYEEARKVDFEGSRVLVVRAEHLMATMLDVGRPKDHLRLLMFLEMADYRHEKLMDVIKRHGLKEKWERFTNMYCRGETES